VRKLEALYFRMNGSDGRGFNDVYEAALLAKINSPPSAKGAAIVRDFKRLRDQAREEARRAFPNDAKKAATMTSALMRDRLFLHNNPGIKLPRGVPLGFCSVIVRRFLTEDGVVNEQVAGLVPTEDLGKGPNQFPFWYEIPKGKQNVHYVHDGT
jgi:hypothetical protein